MPQTPEKLSSILDCLGPCKHSRLPPQLSGLWQGAPCRWLNPWAPIFLSVCSGCPCILLRDAHPPLLPLAVHGNLIFPFVLAERPPSVLVQKTTRARLETQDCPSDDVLKCQSVSRVRLSATPWTAARQAPLSMGFPRQEYWGGPRHAGFPRGEHRGSRHRFL